MFEILRCEGSILITNYETNAKTGQSLNFVYYLIRLGSWSKQLLGYLLINFPVIAYSNYRKLRPLFKLGSAKDNGR
jgi:hypothetical protein